MNEDNAPPQRHPTGPRLGGPEPSPPGGNRPHAIDLLLVLAITAGLYVLVGTLVDAPEITVGFILTMLAIQSAIPMAAVYLVVIRRRGLSWQDLGLRAVGSRWIPRAAVIALIALPVVALVNLATQAVTGAPFRNPQLDMLAPEGFTWSGLLGMLVMVGIVAPIVEEIVFRGLLYGWLRPKLGVSLGAGLSALAFAAAHGIGMLIPALFVIGLILTWVYERSGSLWPPIIVHGVFNMVMTIALYAALAAGVSLQ